MVTEAAVWAIFLLPLGSFALIALVIRPFLNRISMISGLATIVAMGGAFGFSIWTLRSVILGHSLNFEPLEWLDTPPRLENPNNASLAIHLGISII